MRSMVGKKDIFLSYAHIDIKFARNIKVGGGNDGGGNDGGGNDGGGNDGGGGGGSVCSGWGWCSGCSGWGGAWDDVGVVRGGGTYSGWGDACDMMWCMWEGEREKMLVVPLETM